MHKLLQYFCNPTTSVDKYRNVFTIRYVSNEESPGYISSPQIVWPVFNIKHPTKILIIFFFFFVNPVKEHTTHND